MNYEISLEEMNRLGKEILSKQSKITFEEAKIQVQKVKQQSSQKNKKQEF